ncbi:MAG: protein kinase family protein [Eubacteriales bacterium]|nr:protein kinase family protein [Eubacteriales bacterium]MDD4630543.1 protein kinase family protein [Eubacteriales bacterium]
MNIENYIESQYRELLPYGLNTEHADLYAFVGNQKLREVLTTLHYHLISLFRTMNERLPSGENGAHFWADPSRLLIKVIEITLGTYNAVKGSEYAFEIDSYYNELIMKCRDFLSSSGGSLIPADMPKIDLYYVQPIFLPTSVITVSNLQTTMNFELKHLGEGSYANVFKYKDTFYNRNFALKRAKKDLTDKELARFKREFDEMDEFSSPYILEVYCYNAEKNEYIMEYMDDTLDGYITKHNAILTMAQRKGIAQQILRAFDYIHSKKRLHRDVSPKNILIRVYDDVPVVKIADFGLVKIPDSNLTTANTEFKGYFNDPSLIVDGFDTYNIHHETYALTRVIYYVMTGRTNIEKAPASLSDFIQRGLSTDKAKRFKNTNEMAQALRAI